MAALMTFDDVVVRLRSRVTELFARTPRDRSDAVNFRDWREQRVKPHAGTHRPCLSSNALPACCSMRDRAGLTERGEMMSATIQRQRTRVDQPKCAADRCVTPPVIGRELRSSTEQTRSRAQNGQRLKDAARDAFRNLRRRLNMRRRKRLLIQVHGDFAQPVQRSANQGWVCIRSVDCIGGVGKLGRGGNQS